MSSSDSRFQSRDSARIDLDAKLTLVKSTTVVSHAQLFNGGPSRRETCVHGFKDRSGSAPAHKSQHQSESGHSSGRTVRFAAHEEEHHKRVTPVEKLLIGLQLLLLRRQMSEEPKESILLKEPCHEAYCHHIGPVSDDERLAAAGGTIFSESDVALVKHRPASRRCSCACKTSVVNLRKAARREARAEKIAYLRSKCRGPEGDEKRHPVVGMAERFSRVHSDRLLSEERERRDKVQQRRQQESVTQAQEKPKRKHRCQLIWLAMRIAGVSIGSRATGEERQQEVEKQKEKQTKNKGDEDEVYYDLAWQNERASRVQDVRRSRVRGGKGRAERMELLQHLEPEDMAEQLELLERAGEKRQSRQAALRQARDGKKREMNAADPGQGSSSVDGQVGRGGLRAYHNAISRCHVRSTRRLMRRVQSGVGSSQSRLWDSYHAETASDYFVTSHREGWSSPRSLANPRGRDRDSGEVLSRNYDA